MGILGAALTSVSPEDMAKIITEYGPAIEALIRFIETQRDDKIRALSMDSITRGLHYASQTGDTTQLESAIKDHCGANGCKLP
jgi:hypothetical protein